VNGTGGQGPDLDVLGAGAAVGGAVVLFALGRPGIAVSMLVVAWYLARRAVKNA
jgi:hypothetical protein